MRKLLMVSTFLLTIVRGVWAMEPESAAAYLPIVTSMLKGNNVDFAQLMPTGAKAFSALAAVNSDVNVVVPHPYYGFKGVTTKNSVAIIPLIGAVMKYDYCGSPGTKTLQQYFLQVEQNPAFIGSVLLVDTPGGAAGGTGNLSQLIYALNKQVVTYVEGMMCSAGVWIGSAADEVIISFPTDIVGSIGTYLTLPDYSKQLEMEGINLHEIYATKSTEKNGVWKEALTGNYAPIRSQLIDPINESFLAGMKRNRYGKGLNANVLKGGTYMGNDAINNGLVDSIGNLDFAIQRVLKIAA